MICSTQSVCRVLAVFLHVFQTSHVSIDPTLIGRRITYEQDISFHLTIIFCEMFQMPSVPANIMPQMGV